MTEKLFTETLNKNQKKKKKKKKHDLGSSGCWVAGSPGCRVAESQYNARLHINAMVA